MSNRSERLIFLYRGQYLICRILESCHFSSQTWTKRGKFLILTNASLQTDHQLFNTSPLDLSGLLPFSCYLSASLLRWQLRNTRPGFSKKSQVNTQHPLFLLPPPPAAVPPLPPLSVSLDVDNGIFCEQVTKTQRMWVCVWLCVCPSPYCHRLSGPEREREMSLTKWQQDCISVPHCDQVGVTNLVWLSRRREGGRVGET